MSTTTMIGLEVRQAIRDTLMRYVWSMDTGNIDGVVATFVEDGEVTDVTGKRWNRAAGGVRGFATHFLSQPQRPPGQHLVQEMLVAPAGEALCRVVSYWSLLVWDPRSDEKSIRLLGSYRDTCVRVEGSWLIREKIIEPWNEATLARLRVEVGAT